MVLGGRLVWDGLGGDEIGLKTGGVRIEQLLDAFGALGPQDKADVVILDDAIGYFRIGVSGSIGMFLASERKNDCGIIVARCGQIVRPIPRSDFKAGPLAPEVDSGGGLDDLGNVGAADASGDFDEVKLAVGVRAEEFGMSNSAHEAEAIQ